MANPRPLRSAPEQFLRLLREQPDYHGQLRFAKPSPAQKASYATLGRTLHRALSAALKAQGIERLYSHQAEAVRQVLDGKHVIITSGTASGKTLCYNLPVLDVVLRDPQSRALYLFPTKALAQDQLRALAAFQLALGGVRLTFGAYDGDTPAAQRPTVRERAQIVLSNPDMLSAAILPHHVLWELLFRNLRYVVVDEAHAYSGVFGSHVAAVIRRLARVCSRYGSRPQFIFCSATIANPAEHARHLCGSDVAVVADDGSPRGKRWFALWNPAPLDQNRRATTGDAAYLLSVLVRAGMRTIAFAPSRRAAELVLAETRRRLERTAPRLAQRVGAYRAGYRAETRRAIEKNLFGGELLAVAATSALELGIDIGDLDATLLVGYPGSAASFRQQAGRSGRGIADALTLLVAGDDPIDQYYAQHPEIMLAQPVERALIAPDNPYILEKHLPCAAQEVPLTNRDERLFGPGFVDAMVRLENAGTLVFQDDRWAYRGPPNPARRLGLRSIAQLSPVKLVHASDPSAVIEEIDGESARFRIHEGAIYLHQGDAYLVTRFDTSSGVALARRSPANYYTEPRTLTQLHIVRIGEMRAAGRTRAYYGTVRVFERLVGYRRRQRGKDTVTVDFATDSAPYVTETDAVWWDVPQSALTEISAAGRRLGDCLHAVEHICAGLLPLFAMCDRQDIGGLSLEHHADTGKPQVFLFDGVPGGMGISKTGYANLEKLWTAAFETVSKCTCRNGCPACIQSPQCQSGNERLDKRGAVLLLKHLAAKR